MRWDFEKNERGFLQKYLSDKFFDSLRVDYPKFNKWYMEHLNDEKRSSYYWSKDGQLGAFTALKIEKEKLLSLPEERRLKITTIKSNDQLERFSEMVFYKAFKKAREESISEVYFTIIDDTESKKKLVDISKSYGFNEIGIIDASTQEKVLFKDISIATNDWRKSYPKFIIKKSQNRDARIMPVDSKYHDNYLQDAELANTKQFDHDFSKATIKKAYIHKQKGLLEIEKGDVLFIYRKWDGPHSSGYKSVVTGIGEVLEHKIKGIDYNNVQEFKKIVKNIHAFSNNEIEEQFDKWDYITIFAWIEPFGKGKNINWYFLREIGVEGYLSSIKLTDQQIKLILKKSRGHV